MKIINSSIFVQTLNVGLLEISWIFRAFLKNVHSTGRRTYLNIRTREHLSIRSSHQLLTRRRLIVKGENIHNCTFTMEKHNCFSCWIVNLEDSRSLNEQKYYLFNWHFSFDDEPPQHKLLLLVNFAIFLGATGTGHA